MSPDAVLLFRDLAPVALVALLVALGIWRAYLYRREHRLLGLQPYESLFHGNPDAVVWLDPDGTVRRVNAAFTHLTGWTQDHIEGTAFTDSVAADGRSRVSTALADACRGRPQTYETVLEDRRKRLVEVKLTSVPIRNESRVIGVFQIFQDIGLRKEIERKLERQAHHDYLTGLPNRALFNERLKDAFERVRRPGTSVALFYVDLDGFKAINDRAGHDAGDKLLKTVAGRLGCFLRGGDTVARLGGDEFAVLMEEVDGESAAVGLAERIVSLFYEPFYWQGQEYLFAGSVGGAVSTPELDTPAELVRRADIAMYAAKGLGGRRYQMYRPALEGPRDVITLELATDLRRGLEAGEFVVHYQPIVDLAGTRIAGVEALVRWQHPDFGLLGPNQFIPLAEETGLIIALDHWVLGQACRDMHHLSKTVRGTPPFLSVNYSRLHLDADNALEAISSILDTERFDPHRLQLEITERVAGNDRAKLTELKSLGVSLAIDDFGTGYSSLSYLRNVPVDVLKIDRSFVQTLGEDQSAAAIVRTILTLAEMLHMGVIIEGIEDAAQLRQLQQLGGRLVQGFYFAEPMELPALERVMKKGLLPEWVARLRPAQSAAEGVSGAA